MKLIGEVLGHWLNVVKPLKENIKQLAGFGQRLSVRRVRCSVRKPTCNPQLEPCYL